MIKIINISLWFFILIIISQSCITKRINLASEISVVDFGAKTNDKIDDTRAIQKAVNFTASNGQTLILAKGEYLVSSPIIIPSQSKIIGENGAKLTQTITAKPVMLANSVKNIIISNLTVMGTGQYSNKWTSSEGRKDRGIQLVNCENIEIKHCRFLNNALSGIHIVGGRKINIDSNYVEGTHRFSTPLNSGENYQFGIALTTSQNSLFLDDIRVANNEVCYTNQGIVTSQGAKLQSSQIKINNNKIHDVIGQHGVYTSTSNTEIYYNTVHRSGLEGIKVQAAHCDLKNISIIGNEVFDCTQSQAFNITEIKDGKYQIKNVEIRDCSASNSARGINLHGNISGLTIDNFLVTKTTNQHGIYMSGSGMNDIKISNTILKDIKGYDILIDIEREHEIDFSNIQILSSAIKSEKYHSIYIVKGENISFNQIDINKKTSRKAINCKTVRSKVRFKNVKINGNSQSN